MRRLGTRSGCTAPDQPAVQPVVVCAIGFHWDPFPDIVINGSVEALRDAIIAEIDEGIEAGVVAPAARAHESQSNF